MNGDTLEEKPKVKGSHIGIGAVATLVVAVLSTPGFFAWVGDGGTKAEVAYEVLQAEINALNKSEERLFGEMQNLRKSMFLLYTQHNQMSMYGGMGLGMGMPMGGTVFSSEEILGNGMSMPFTGESRAGGRSESAPEPSSLPPLPKSMVHPLEPLLAPSKSPSLEQRKPLPDKLVDILRKK